MNKRQSKHFKYPVFVCVSCTIKVRFCVFWECVGRIEDCCVHTNTHLGTGNLISPLIHSHRHTHTHTHSQITMRVELHTISNGILPFTTIFPSPDWLSRYHHHQLIKRLLPAPPPLSQPFTTSLEISYWLAPGYWFAGRQKGCWDLGEFFSFSSDCSVSHLLPSSRPSPSYGLLEKNQHKFSLFFVFQRWWHLVSDR